MSAPTHTAQLGEKFGKYHVLGRIAQGGMAEIFKVKTVGLAGFEKLQVLKKILPAQAQNPRFIRSFIDEARIAVSLNHRNIVQVFEFGRVASELFLAMELIEGVNLRDAAIAASRRRTRPTIPMCCYILSEVASGLDYAHRRKDHDGRALGIVHCDVSPQNVALSWEGYVKILDFGVARATFVAAEKGRLRGKPRYMSPEQTRGEIPTAATDVFALGVVAWELLCGAPLFDGPDVESILKAIQRLDVPAPASENPEIPPALSRAVVRALSRAPEARGLASDLGAAFAQTQRDLDPGLGARSLSRWLAELFPESPLNGPPVDEIEGEPATWVPGLASLLGGNPDGSASEPSASTASGSTNPTVPGGSELSEPTVPTRPGEPLALSIEPSVSLEPELEVLDEKRRVVVVACLVDGPREAARQVSRVLADLTYKEGAIVHAQSDDGVVAVFGLEIAGDDDVVSALAFAVDAHDALREAGLGLRVGIRQGVARRRSGAVAAGYGLLGDVLEETRTLASSASPGRTWFGGVPGRLASAAYGFRELSPLRRRGRRMRLFELAGARAPEAFAPPPTAGPLVGRVRELAGLLDAWHAAVAGGTQIACALVGEAGIGKTRLAAELAARVAEEHGEVLVVAAPPGGRDAPYAAVTELLHLELGLSPARGPAARTRLLGRLERLLEDAGEGPEERDEVIDALALALEVAGGATPPGDLRASLRERIAFAMGTLRALRGAGPPRLIVIDGWHWLDAASAEVFQLLVATPAPGAQLVVLIARPGDQGEAPAWPPTVSPVIRLGELQRADALALIQQRLYPNASDDEIDMALRRAGGNPLFIEELALAAADLAPGEMPESARSVVAARVDRLPRAAKAALQHAAVVGPIFRARLLEELLGPGVQRALTILEHAGIVTRKGVDEGELAFRHGLLQEVVYESLAGTARRDTHRRVGQLLSEHYESGRVKTPEAIARHLELGGDGARAAIFYLRAGKLALLAGGAAAAVHDFTRALELGPGGPEREREALAGREQALAQLGDHAAQRQDLEALTRLSAGDDRRLADVLTRTGQLHLRSGELTAAIASAEAAERAAERAGDPRARAEALRTRAEAHERSGQADRALDAVARALDLLRTAGRSAPGDQNDEARALVVAGRVHLGALRLDDALVHYRPALARARATGDHWLERVIENHVALVHLYRGELGEAMANAQQALEICRRSGDRAREGDNTALVGSILLEIGLTAEARQWIVRGLAIHTQTGSRLSRADALVHAGRNEVLAGNLDEALALLEEASALAREIGAAYPLCNAENQLAHALVVRAGSGDLSRALRHAGEADAIARAAGLHGCAIQAASRTALALLELGDARAALPASARAVSLLDEVGVMEGSEEEVAFTHHRVLRALRESSTRFLDRAWRGYQEKLSRLDVPEWRRAFADLPLHRQIRDDATRS